MFTSLTGIIYSLLLLTIIYLFLVSVKVLESEDNFLSKVRSKLIAIFASSL